MKTSFKRNLVFGFSFSLLLLILSAVASFVSIRNLLASNQLVQHTETVIRNLEQMLSTLKDAETGQRGYLLTGQERFLEPYIGARQRALNQINTVKLLTRDDPMQQKVLDELAIVVDTRMQLLAKLVDYKRQAISIPLEELDTGKLHMDRARLLVKQMTDIEEKLLSERLESLSRFATNTPALIVVASLMAILITVIMFFQLNSDFNKRSLLQKELEQKDKDISRRISIIQNVAETVAGGDYSVRTNDTGSDGLGVLSASLNKMADSLDNSFQLLSEKEWLQSGIAGINTELLGEDSMEVMAEKVVSFLVEYTGSISGAMYLMQDGKRLKFAGGYACEVPESGHTIEVGEGLIGQAAKDVKVLSVGGIREHDVLVTYATGALKPRHIVAIPVTFERHVMGIIEMASLTDFTPPEMALFENVGGIIGIAINTTENRKRLQSLLEETQAQSEELQAQHREMENINEELEVQAQKLQASEEELKVQQEELLQTNQELEERSRQLEERNQLITERNHEIQSKAEQLAQSTKYKSEFLANMSHELRTPLNSILLLSRLMTENMTQNLSDEQIEYAKVIQNSGQGLLALINEILDLSKIESGKMDLHIEEVRLQDMSDGMVSLFRPLADEKHLEFRVEVSEDVPHIIKTDRMRVEQVLKNLLSNAFKFTSEGRVGMRVFRYAGKNDFVAFEVEDSGIGIAPEKQSLIFEAFQQEDGSTRRKFGGTGLGLSISRELAKLLGGEILLTSKPGEGSKFTFVIPEVSGQTLYESTTAVPAASSTELVEQEAEPQKEKRYLSDDIPEQIPDDRGLIQPGDKIILIIEDDMNFAKSLLEFTRKQGYKGLVCVRGDEAINYAEKYQPRGILLDIQLPVKDGMEVMDELKSNPLTRHIPVHMMSSYEMKTKSLSKGAIDFIDKPVAFEKMQDIFDKLEFVLTKSPQKVLIVEENTKHAKALAYFLESNNVTTEIRSNVQEGIAALSGHEVNCVILDMGVPGQKAYDTLDAVKKTPGLENLPIIIFTGKSLSKSEELRIRQYADSIVIKTAFSYQRIKDEVSLFLHLVEERSKKDVQVQYKKLGALNEVLKGKTVLVADDDVRNIYSLTRALESFGMQVITAVDGKEALEKLKEAKHVDIILMDMMMPEMDGYDTTRAIKAMKDFRRIPVIAVTAKAMLGDREKCIEAGASDYITKPVDIDQLLSLLRVWLYDQK